MTSSYDDRLSGSLRSPPLRSGISPCSGWRWGLTIRTAPSPRARCKPPSLTGLAPGSGGLEDPSAGRRESWDRLVTKAGALFGEQDMLIPVTDGPLVSVGIPTFNRPAGLRRTLACITRQTYGNLDIIVSDNASPTAATEAVVREFADRDGRLRCFRQPENIGLDANFKFVLRQARGPYFFWAADDDEWTPDFVTACMAHAGQADLGMTNMRAAVRPRGLLRPKPPLNLSADHSPFANALAFLSNIQPSLFYGIFRTEALRPVLGERMFDYYDYYFILERILTGGVHVVPSVCFSSDVDADGPALQ